MNRFTVLSLISLFALVIAIPVYVIAEQTRLSIAQASLREQYIEDATVLYLEYCAECHGLTGEGVGLNPTLNRLGMSEADPDLLFRIIARASHGSTMASWHLAEGGIFNDYQIRELVTLMRFVDWDQVGQMATQRGIEYQELSTYTLEDITANMMTEDNPHQCIACHEEPQVHADQFGLDCVRCHTLIAWTPATLTRHTFKLDHGDEGDLACKTCHTEKYTRITCYECHDHKPDQMVEVHQPEGIFELENCIVCHPTGEKGEGGQFWQKIRESREEQRSN